MCIRDRIHGRQLNVVWLIHVSEWMRVFSYLISCGVLRKRIFWCSCCAGEHESASNNTLFLITWGVYMSTKSIASRSFWTIIIGGMLTGMGNGSVFGLSLIHISEPTRP